MTHEEMERAIEFLLQQEVRFAQQQAESDKRFEQTKEFLLENQAKADSEMAQLRVLDRKLVQRNVKLERTMTEIAETQKQIVVAHRELAEAQKETERTFRAFISSMGQRYGGNGHRRNPRRHNGS